MSDVFYCPRSCHEGRTYPTLDAVKTHVAGQHPEYDPNWAGEEDNGTTAGSQDVPS